MSIAIRNIFTGLHPKLANHIGNGLAVEKSVNPSGTNSVSGNASDRAAVTGKFKDILISSDTASKNSIAPELNKQSPVVQISDTQLPELFITNNIPPEKVIFTRNEIKKTVKQTLPELPSASEENQTDSIRTAGYIITIPGGQSNSTESTTGLLPPPINKANGYTNKNNPVGKMVNLTIL